MKFKSAVQALCTLLLCACAARQHSARPAVIPLEGRTTSTSSTSATLVDSGQEAVVDRKLADIDQFSVQEGDRPPVIENEVRGSELLAARAAVQAVLAVKARVLEEFRGPCFVVVHQKLDDAFRKTVGENHLEHKKTLSGEDAVTSTSLHEVLQEITALVKSIANQADVRATFVVHTEPPAATFQICPQYLTTGCIHVTTDATIVAIFRGLYTYRISLAGYQTIEYSLDLVHFGQTRLDCRLHAKTVSPCTPR